MENKHKNIAHPGIIEQINKGQLMVRIQQQSACGNCHSHAHCSMADNSGKLIEVSISDTSAFETGQEVTLFLAEKLGYKALLLGYLLPLLILLTTVIVMVNTTGNDGLSALVAVGVMLPYYAVLYKMRGRLRKTFEFKIRN